MSNRMRPGRENGSLLLWLCVTTFCGSTHSFTNGSVNLLISKEDYGVAETTFCLTFVCRASGTARARHVLGHLTFLANCLR